MIMLVALSGHGPDLAHWDNVVVGWVNRVSSLWKNHGNLDYEKKLFLDLEKSWNFKKVQKNLEKSWNLNISTWKNHGILSVIFRATRAFQVPLVQFFVHFIVH